MGVVKLLASIGRSRDDLREREFLVDTGSFYTAITPDLGAELELPVGVATQVQLADGRIVDTQVTIAYVKIGDRGGAVPVEVGEVPVPLLGASALEALGLTVDAVDGKLIERLPFPGAIRYTRLLRPEGDSR
jgi:predicted aspartyl protease